MKDLVLQNIAMLHLFWLLPVLLGFLIRAAQVRKKALAGFVAAPLLPGMLLPADPARRIVKQVCLLAALAAIFFSLSRPAWNKKEIPVKQSGRDVVFMLDVSRSMLAEDLVPNRLERAKLAIADAMEVLQGDRVALVPFAGTVIATCPLTTDYAFFRMSLEATGMGSVSRGSTMIGDAVRFVLHEVFDDQTSQYRDIILITDGEDHESSPLEAARLAGERGVRMIIVGLGDETEGSRIPIIDSEGRRTFMKYQGREIWTKLDAETLRRMAAATPGGFYLPVSTGNIDLGKVYRELMSTAARREFEEKNLQGYEEKFQIFLGLALALLAVEAAFAEGRRNEKALILLLSIFCLVLLPLPAWAESADGLVARGNKAYAAGDIAGAKAAYDRAGEMDPAAPEPDFNRGAVLFRQNDFEGARAAYELAGGKATDPLLVAQSKYNIGNAFLQQAAAAPVQDNQRALGLLQQGAEYFQQALSLDADLADAARNLEITRQRLARLQEQARENPQQDAGGPGRPEGAEKNRQEDREEAAKDQDQQKEQAEGKSDNSKDKGEQGETREEKEESLPTAGQAATSPPQEEGEEKSAAPSQTAADILNREIFLQRLRMKRQAAELPRVDKDW